MVLMLKLLNVNSAPLNFIDIWKSRNKHRYAQAKASKTFFAHFPMAQSIYRGFSYL
jgi:hypothetical protein